MHVAIVGAGIVGLSLAWRLVRQGVKVTLFDQGAIPNPVGSSFDEHRITRHTYTGLDGYGALMVPTFALYDELWRDLGRSHYLSTGLLYVSRLEHDLYGAAAGELDALGIAHRPVSTEEIASRLHFLNIDGVRSAFEADGAGMLFAQRIITDLAAWLASNGADLRPYSRVEAVDAQAGTVVVAGKTIGADQVVVSAGAWVSDLLPHYGSRLVASRQMVLYVEPPQDMAAPPVIVDVADGHGIYVLPPRNGTRLKLGDHHFTRRGHGGDDRIATQADAAAVEMAFSRAFIRPGDYQTLERKVCYYTVTEDERFVVEPVGPSLWVASACSGHGFKLGVLVGDILARALTHQLDKVDASRYLAGLSA